ncbi:MAG: biotin/lipoyl-binding protein [Bacteroidia bacterium]|nr:biotin/lipoyl-binding protein [Bacteroidia bacterium]
MEQKKITKRRSTRWIWISALIILIGGGVAYRFSNQKKELLKVETTVAEKRTIYARVTESGTIQPTIEVPVSPDISGEVVELYVKEGQVVKKGQLLAVIRPDNYKSALEQAQASVNTANSDYMQAQAAIQQTQVNIAQDSVNVNRLQKLHKEKLISDQELENAILKYNLSKSQYEASKYTIQSAFYRLKSSEASLKQSRQNLDRTSIYATMDGTITQLNVEAGQKVVGTVQMAGTEMMKIADLSSMEVVVDINENEIVKLNTGDSAVVEVDAIRDRKFSGRVTDIAYSASRSGLGTTDQVTSFQVKVRINPASYSEMTTGSSGPEVASRMPFRPGMSALVEIYTDKVEDVVAIPLQAVTLHKDKKPEEKKTGWGKPEEAPKEAPKTDTKNQPVLKEVVFVFDNGKVKEFPVKLGIKDDTYVEILEGISVGTKVVSGPYTTLTKELYDGLEVEETKDTP